MDEKRYSLTYEDYNENDKDIEYLVNEILNNKCLPELKSIIIGSWGECYDTDCQELIDMFVEHKDKFQHIESIFIGDMDYEECECSWILQGDYTQLLKSLPNLKKLTIKGSTGLVINEINHNNLQHLELISGGVPVEVVKNLSKSSLPNLETLILYVGVEDYGWDGETDDLKPLASKELFPKLKHLGIVNSEEQDSIVEFVLSSNILPQLEVLQLSYGCLTDKGGQAFLDAKDKLLHLKELNLKHNFLSEDMASKLENLPIQVDISENQEADDDYMWPMLTE